MPMPIKKNRNGELMRDYKALVKQDIKRAAKKVAIKYGISERRVFAILKRYNKNVVSEEKTKVELVVELYSCADCGNKFAKASLASVGGDLVCNSCLKVRRGER